MQENTDYLNQKSYDKKVFLISLIVVLGVVILFLTAIILIQNTDEFKYDERLDEVTAYSEFTIRIFALLKVLQAQCPRTAYPAKQEISS